MSDPFLSSEEYGERAHELYNQGAFDEAIEVLREGLAVYPFAAELHVGQGYARLAREAVASGAAVQDPRGFARWVREAGFVLSRAATDAEDALVRQLEGVIAGMRGGGGAEPPVPAEPAAIAPAPPAAPHRPRAPSTMAAPAVRDAGEAGGAEAAEAAEAAPGLVGSYARYDRLVATLGLGTPSLAEFLSGPSAVPSVSPAPPAAPDVMPGRFVPRAAALADLEDSTDLAELPRGIDGGLGHVVPVGRLARDKAERLLVEF